MERRQRAQQFLADLPKSLEDLPLEPGALRELFLHTSGSSTASLEKIGGIIAKGQGLSTRVLALANSAFYGLQSEVTSVERAVAVLGLSEVRALVVMLGVSDLAGKHAFPASFNIKGYWTHQVGVAIVSRLIAQYDPKMDGDTLYAAGLLHDVGKLFIAAYAPDAWMEIYGYAEKHGLSDIQAEEGYWGLDHAVIGAQVLEYWNFPHLLSEPISWHHQPHYAPSHKREAAVVHVADALLRSRQERAIPLSNAASTLLQRFVSDVDSFMEKLDESLDEEKIAAMVSLLT